MSPPRKGNNPHRAVKKQFSAAARLPGEVSSTENRFGPAAGGGLLAAGGRRAAGARGPGLFRRKTRHNRRVKAQRDYATNGYHPKDQTHKVLLPEGQLILWQVAGWLVFLEATVLPLEVLASMGISSVLTAQISPRRSMTARSKGTVT